MAIRLSGLTSGLDTDAIVQELVSAYSLKTQKYEKQQTKLNWKQETWKNLNTKIYSLYTNVSNLRFSSAYNLRKVTVSDNTKATITASSEAVKGTQKLNILQTAQSAYITGADLGKDVTANTKLSELGFTGKETEIEVKKNDGTSEKIKVTADTTIKEFTESLKTAGLNASFDTTNHRFFVSSKESGVANDFSLLSKDGDGQAALECLGLATALVDENGAFTVAGKTYQEAYAYYQKAAASKPGQTLSADDVKAYIEDQIKKYDELTDEKAKLEKTIKDKQSSYDKKQAEYKMLQEKYEAIEDIDERLSELGKQDDIDKNVSEAEKKVDDLKAEFEKLDPSDENYETKQKELEAAQTDYDEKVKTQTEYKELTRLKALPGEITDEETARKDAETKLSTVEAELATLDVDSFIKMRGVKGNDGKYAGAEQLEEHIQELSQRAVRANEILTDTTDRYKQAGAVKVEAADAVIKLNGVEFTNTTNNFSINGLSITANAVTGDGDSNAVQVTTSVDTQGIYDKIKDFLTEYNNVINEMCKLYNADSARDYEPLTDEEKEAMSDEQIEKWENKIKSALLRRDTTLNSVMSGMVNSMAQVFEINGSKYSLSTFGISTLGFLNAAENENYAYHIDGDPDDENTAENKDKLMAAIENDPESVMEFMKKLTSNLYTTIDEKMKSTELSSAYKVYNDKEMDKEVSNIEKLISDWEDKVAEKEDYYYNKFSQMEVALSKLQNQTSSISSLLGS